MYLLVVGIPSDKIKIFSLAQLIFLGFAGEDMMMHIGSKRLLVTDILRLHK